MRQLRGNLLALAGLCVLITACSQETPLAASATSLATMEVFDLRNAAASVPTEGFSCQMGNTTLEAASDGSSLLTIRREDEILEILTVEKVTYARLKSQPSANSSASRREIASSLDGRWGTLERVDAILASSIPGAPFGCLEWMGLRPTGVAAHDGLSKLRDPLRNDVTILASATDGQLSQINVENGIGTTIAVITFGLNRSGHSAPSDYSLISVEEYRLLVGE